MPPRETTHLPNHPRNATTGTNDCGSPVRVFDFDESYHYASSPANDDNIHRRSLSSGVIKTSLPAPPIEAIEASEAKSVRFAPTPVCVRFAPPRVLREIFPIDSRKDMTTDEITATWYDKQDLKKIREATDVILFRLATGQRLTDGSTARGIEHLTKDGSKSYFKHRAESLVAVLEEQERQRRSSSSTKVPQDEAIARAYIKHTTKCQTQAIQRAKHDEKEVGKIVSKDLELSLLLSESAQQQLLHGKTKISAVGFFETAKGALRGKKLRRSALRQQLRRGADS